MRKAHILKHNKKAETPRHYLFFDCETEVIDNNDEKEKHILKLGIARYYRLDYVNHFISECIFHNSKEFYNYVDSVVKPNTKLVCFALNLPFDFTVSGIIHELQTNEWDLVRIFYDSNISILKFRKGNRSLLFLDVFNYVKTSVQSLGKTIGLEKLDIDFQKCTDNELIEYCRRDVEIIARFMLELIKFIHDNDLATFGVTLPSIAFSSFRHKFMKHNIFIHNHPEAMKLERDSYFGGRVECFYIGDYTKQTYLLDVNSMYPFIMANYYMPTKLWRYSKYGVDIESLKNYLEDNCIIAEVNIKTDKPVYPVKHDDKLIFPVGSFTTVLCSESLKYALQHGHIQYVKRYAVYDKAVIFKDYVDYYYSLKQKYELEGNKVYRTIVKLLLNSLYGKFGQKNHKLEVMDYNPFPEYDRMNIINENGKREGTIIKFANYTIKRSNDGEDSYNSFTAIASHVTDSARVYLWQLIDMAGNKNVLYCDTDSLIVTDKGYRNLQPLVGDNQLGLLKFENSYDWIKIRGLKDYETPDIVKIKGISKNAVQISDNEYKQNQFPSFAGNIRNNMKPEIIIKHVVKQLSRNYNKGRVTKSGWVKPYRLYSK